MEDPGSCVFDGLLFISMKGLRGVLWFAFLVGRQRRWLLLGERRSKGTGMWVRDLGDTFETMIEREDDVVTIGY